jgi:hypothetical protein
MPAGASPGVILDWHGESVYCRWDMPKTSKGPKWRQSWTYFGDFADKGSRWITVAGAEYYPDYLVGAVERYTEPLRVFGELATQSPSSAELFRNIMEVRDVELRKALARIFRRYVSPTSPVELLKRKLNVEKTLRDFGKSFRPIAEVRAAYESRPAADEAIAAVLKEHQERGKKGAELTNQFFAWVRLHLPGVSIRGGRDIPLRRLFPDYPKNRGVDFVMEEDDDILAVGYLHYDSDRGGAQEADRTGGYREAAEEIVPFLQRTGRATKLVYVNDGPGLLAGAMWRKYAELEKQWPYRIMVATLKMLRNRLSVDWLRS